MNKNTIVTDLQLNVSGALASLKKITNQLSNSGAGQELTQDILSQVKALEGKLSSLKMPDIESGSKDFQKFYNEMVKIEGETKRVLSSLDGFKVSDDYLKNNVEELRQLASAAQDARGKLAEVKKQISGSLGTYVTEGEKRKSQQTDSQMRAYAKDTNLSQQEKENQIKAIYSTRAAELSDSINTEQNPEKVEKLKQDLSTLTERKNRYLQLIKEEAQYTEDVNRTQTDYGNRVTEIQNTIQGELSETNRGLKEIVVQTNQAGKSAFEMGQEMQQMEGAANSIGQLGDQIAYLFSATSIFYALRRVVSQVIEDFKELDKQFNEIAIVSEYSTKEMWGTFSKVNKVAQEFGVETKNVLEVQNLYYHQGKSMAEVNKLTAQTLTLAKITGMDYERATSDLTAALNAYNIAAEDAVRVTDTIASMDTNAAISSEELMTALTKTASIAANAGMSLESTEVFLTKMIETTREAPENLGTALKTIIARFGQVKEEIDGEEIELADINQVDTALKTIGISLLDTAGQIRDLDGVFMELSSKWDDLDRNTQRYIATVAAGSRQQSRFIAMMENYDRTLELTEIAQESAGLGARQLAKSQESIETSVNRLKSTWQEFYSKLITSDFFKGILDSANALLTIVNKLPGPIAGVAVAMTLWALKVKVLDKALLYHKIVSAGVAKGEDAATIAGRLQIAMNAQKESSFRKLMKTMREVSIIRKNMSNEEVASAISTAAAEKAATAQKIAALNALEKEYGELTIHELAADAADGTNKYASVITGLGLTREAVEELAKEYEHLTVAQLTQQQVNELNNTDKSVDIGMLIAEKEAMQELTEEYGKQSVAQAINEAIEDGADADNPKDLAERVAKILLLKKENEELNKNSIAKLFNSKIKAGNGKLGDTFSQFFGGKGKKGGLLKGGKASGGIGKTISTLFGGLKTAFAGVGKILLTLGIKIAAVVGAIVAVIAIYKKFIAVSLDDTKKVKKLEKAREEYNDTLKEYNDLKEKAKTLEEYSNKKNLTAEELKEQNEVSKELVNTYPELLNYIDEEGNYHLKNAKAIQEEIDKKEELLEIEGEQYNKLRLDMAKDGIYADESTSAGKTMKNIQDYAASFSEDKKALQEKADEIDAAWQGVQFNGSQYKKIMKAYGEGKKFSFDEKDMSALFAGNIGETNWNEFLEAVKNNPDIFKDDTTGKAVDKLATELEKTGAYGHETAKEVAEAFMKMDKSNGQLFSQLIQGAAEEYSQIEISQASIYISKGEFAADMSSEITNAMAEAGVQLAKDSVGDEEKWKKKSDKKRSELIEDYSGDIVIEFEKFTKKEGQGLNAVFASTNVEAMKYTDAKDIDWEADTAASQKEAILKFYDELPKEIQKQFPREAIETGSTEVIATLFTLIKNAVGNQDIKTTVENIMTDFNTSKGMYATGNFAFDEEFFKNLTVAQVNAVSNATSKLSIEQVAPYLSTINEEYQKMLKSNPEKASDFLNALLQADFSSDIGVAKATEELSVFGYTSAEVAQMAINAMNGINNISLSDFSVVVEEAVKEMEKLSNGFEGVIALMEGTASVSQLGTYMTTMMKTWTEAYGAEKAAQMIADLGNSIVATGDGFKISKDQGEEYSTSLVDITKNAILSQIALYELKLETEELTEEQRAGIQATIVLLKKQYASVDAQSKKSINDGLVKDLEKAKDKADELVDSLQKLVDWLREYDRYANLDEVISTLQEDFDHLDFEINFSTNTDVIEQDLREQVDNINEQIFANQGGIRAATQEQEMWRDVINKRNSQYVTFDENGNAIVQAKELEKLQYKISQASEERKPILQAEYDEIIANVEAYNKAKDKVEDYSKALEENFKALEEFLKANYESITKVEDKLIEARQAAEDKELEIIKNKYEAIKDENDKYLEDVQEMIDKEREIRDRADREQDVKDKEKKLAMMKMDTSGVYASDIRALEKELEGDYRDLEDDAVDKAIADLEKEYQTQAEILDKEVEYLESSLEYRREIMTEYNQWAQEMMMQGSDTVIEYLKANDEEYYTGTAAAQANWVLEWNNAVAQGVAANNTMATTLDPVMRNLETCQTNANGFEGAVQQYSETALAMNPEVNSTVEELVTQYSNLADGVDDVEFAMDRLAIAYRDAADAASALKAAQDTIVYGEEPPQSDIDDEKNRLKNDNNNDASFEVIKVAAGQGGKTTHKWAGLLEYFKTGQTAKSGNTTYYKVWDPDKQETWNENLWVEEGSLNEEGWVKFNSPIYKKKYAKGGYVDYTGPAWVDGTKSHPEYMLNATQTAQFEALVAALSNLYGNGMSSLKQSSQKIGDAYYNFHINVEQMASDYDVDQLVSRLEQKMVDSSKYRNITLLKKSQ